MELWGGGNFFFLNVVCPVWVWQAIMGLLLWSLSRCQVPEYDTLRNGRLGTVPRY